MRIGALEAHGIKNLELADTPFRAVTLVHGPNGIGKSNLLLLVHSLLRRKIAPDEIRDSIKFPIEGVSPVPDFLRRGGRRGTARLTLECYTTAFKSLLKAFPEPGHGRRSRMAHQVDIEFDIEEYSGGVRFSIKEIRIGTRVIYPSHHGSPLTADQQKAIEDWIAAEVVDSTVYIPANRIHRRDLVPLDLTRVDPAVDHLENAVLRLLTSREEDTRTLDEVRKTMRDFFKVRDIRSELRLPGADTPSAPGLLVGVRLQEESGEWFDLERMGTGIQQILVIVCMIQMSRAKIALVEEFDASLSPEKRSQLLEQLKQLVGIDKPLRQVVATSHSTFRPKQERVLSLGAEKTGAGRVNFRVWTHADWARFSTRDE